MIIKDFEEKNYMKYPVSDYKYVGLFDPISHSLIHNPNLQSDTI